MPTLYRQNGNLIEITTIQKRPSKIRVSVPKGREARSIYRARRLDNIKRTRQTCVRRVSAGIAAFGSPLLATLTFSGDATDAAFANDCLRTFQVRLQAQFPNAQSIFVPELSPKGRIHFHGLIFNVPMSLGDSRASNGRVLHGEERTTRTLATLWGQGFVDVRQTDGSGKLASYISKYITKGGGEILFAPMRILRTSNGFPKEILLRGRFAKRLAGIYAERKPLREWSGENPFLGKITKKTYIKP